MPLPLAELVTTPETSTSDGTNDRDLGGGAPHGMTFDTEPHSSLAESPRRLSGELVVCLNAMVLKSSVTIASLSLLDENYRYLAFGFASPILQHIER